jgi:hypothetical protein
MLATVPHAWQKGVCCRMIFRAKNRERKQGETCFLPFRETWASVDAAK